jgi:ABC-type uncharacterized transport system ATPase subunit
LKPVPDQSPDAVLACRGIIKRFGATKALDGADLTVRRGSVHAVVGQNGAGKTTLMRIVAGELEPDNGELTVKGKVGMVRQHRLIVPELSVLENIVLGAEPMRGPRIDWAEARRKVEDVMAGTGLDLPLSKEADRLPPAMQQRCELVGTLVRGAEILLLDEPTSLLTPQEVDGLFTVVRELVAHGLTVVFISHKLREVVEHCDAVTVFRNGRSVAAFEEGFDLSDVGARMLGHEDHDAVDLNTDEPIARTAGGEVGGVLFSALLSHELPLRIRAGSIVGVAGVAGNGQDELVYHLAGVEPADDFGGIELDGRHLDRLDVRARRRLGLRTIPADVSVDGCALEASLYDNVLTTEVPPAVVGRFGTVRRDRARDYVTDLLKGADVIYSDIDQSASELSGGNRQRLVIGRELSEGARVVVAHEPTRGVDFAAADAIRRRLVAFAAAGGGVLLISSDLDELLTLSDEVAVLYDRRLVALQPRAEVTLQTLGQQLGGLIPGAPA